MKVLHTSQREHEIKIEEIIERKAQREDLHEIRKQVENIIENVVRLGDDALVAYSESFDRSTLNKNTLQVTPEEMDRNIREGANPRVVRALEHAAHRIRLYHQNQRIEPFSVEDNVGIRITQRVRPLERVGVYVPGGKASYPSTVLMTAIPAKVAGVKEVYMVTPMVENREMNPHTLAAARIAGVDGIFRVGGAHAVAALAYGTETVPRVDKIVGPGSVYVDAAKQILFGVVDIDMTAGPSEIMILTDAEGDPRYLAADLLSQAEHDEMAIAILLLLEFNEEQNRLLMRAIQRQMDTLPRWRMVRKVLQDNGAIIVCRDEDEAIELINRFAPEHLEIDVRDPGRLLPRILNVGSVFVGKYTPESLGDYTAGCNHVLPTGRSARFFSPLSVYDFLKRSTVITSSREGLAAEASAIVALARAEGLEAHARAVEVRMEEKDKSEEDE